MPISDDARRRHTCANLCDYAGGAQSCQGGPYCLHLRLFMDDQFFGGAESNCTAGQWAKYREQAIANCTAKNAEVAAAAEAAQVKAIADADTLAKSLGVANDDKFRDALVEGGYIDTDIAIEVAKLDGAIVADIK